MLERLDDPVTLGERARFPLTLAAALASAVLAPLVDQLVLGTLFMNGHSFRLGELLLYGGWGGVLGAALGALAMRTAMRERRGPLAPLGFASLAGLAYPALFLIAPALMALPRADANDIVRTVVLGPLVVTIFGAIASLPAGLGFGVIFVVGGLHAREGLDRPAHDQVAWTWTSAAVLLAGAAIAACFMALALRVPYWQAVVQLFPPMQAVLLPHTDLAWTRIVVIPAPLVIGALACLGASWRERRRVARTVDAVLSGAHPSLVVDDGAGDLDAPWALPLRAIDRDHRRRGWIRPRDGGSAYRDGGPVIAFVGRDGTDLGSPYRGASTE